MLRRPFPSGVNMAIPSSFLLFFFFCNHILASRIQIHSGWSVSPPDLRHYFAASTATHRPRSNAYTAPFLSFFTPILASANFSASKGFALGFYTYRDPVSPNAASATISTVLAVCLGTNRTDSQGRTFSVPVWSANVQKPLKQAEGAALSVAEVGGGGGGRMQLRDGDGSVVWGAEVSGGVAAMEVNEQGDWVVYGPAPQAAWRSFDHPTDTLLQHQPLTVGNKLISNNSLFTMQMMPGGLVFYMNAAAPALLAYWALPMNAATLQYVYQHTFDLSATPSLNMTDSFYSYGGCTPSASSGAASFFPPYAMLSGENLTLVESCPHISAYAQWPRFVNAFKNATYNADYIVLSGDGYPRGFTYVYESGGGTAGGRHFHFSNQAELSYCLAPNACGPYGICGEFLLGTRHICYCPNSDNNPTISDHDFHLIDPSNPNSGCRRTNPLPDCDNETTTSASAGTAAQRHQQPATRLVEIKRTTFVSIHVAFETTYRKHTAPLDECTARCYANCSCSGFFYHHPTSYCLPFSDGPSSTEWLPDVTFINMDNPDFSAYIKLRQQPSGSASVVARDSTHVLGAVLGIGASTVAVIVVLVVLSLWRYRQWRRSTGKDAGGSANANCDSVSSTAAAKAKGSACPMRYDHTASLDDRELAKVLLPVRYSYRELRKATDGFKQMVGRGGFGCVYQGMLRDGRKVAVKKLFTDGGGGGRKEFLAEVAMIGEISHYNIAKLCGFCAERGKRLLVYEYMENGSLDRWLFGGGRGGVSGGSSGATPNVGRVEGGHSGGGEAALLGWRHRYRVALGTARGLAYLHEECHRPIVHFDIKPQNILLDAGFVPKLSDFGLAKLLAARSDADFGVSHRSTTSSSATSIAITAVRGTPGYLAPEWLCHSMVGKKCDVYSYGMVLLELVGGRRNTLPSLTGTERWYYPAWAASMAAEGRLLETIDMRLAGDFDADQVHRVVQVAFLCIQRDPAARPDMSSVCKMLEGTLALERVDMAALHQSLEYAAVSLQLDSDLSVPASASGLVEGR